jgi:pyruvate/2-oxoglutarate dehydrogenase complex dihydrolipoamide dehydrogenase (E3) component
MNGELKYDAIIIGAGQAGVPLSTTLANAGWRVAIVERKHVGGTCVNDGCTPSKTLWSSARNAYLARRLADYGAHTGPVSVDMAEVYRRKQKTVDNSRQSNRRRIESTPGADLLMGEARFTAKKSVSVDLLNGGTQHLTADTILINAGARPRVPQIEGLESVPFLDSTAIMELISVPEHLLVIGGGYIGAEFGHMFQRFGSQVTLIQRADQLLTQEDRDVAEAIADIFREDGIEVLLNSSPVRVAPADDGGVRLSVETPQGERTLTGSHMLLATGRVPNTNRLNLKAAGVERDERGFIRVNERLETNVLGVYALGDIKGGPAFTHISYDDFRILCANLLGDGNQSTAGRLVPYTVFVDPELGRIGLTETAARDQGYKVAIAKMPMSHVARAIEMGETRGFMKAVLDADTGQILGCAILGLFGGEIMAMLEIAMMAGLPYTALRDGVFAHPTLAESLNNLFATVDDSLFSQITRRTQRFSAE